MYSLNQRMSNFQPNPQDLTDPEMNLLQGASQEIKILFILSKHDKIRHSHIEKFNQKYPGIYRKSSRTYYKIYSKLISSGLISKIKDITTNQQYWCYQLTPQGRNYIKFLLAQNPSNQLISYTEYQKTHRNVHHQGESQPQTTLTNFLISEIQDLKKKVNRYENALPTKQFNLPVRNNQQPIEQPIQHSPTGNLPSADNQTPSQEPDSHIEFMDEDENYHLEISGDASTDEEGYIEKESELAFEEFELSEEEKHQQYIESLPDDDYLDYFLSLPKEKYEVEETWGELWAQCSQRSMNSDTKHQYFLSLLERFSQFQLHDGLDILVNNLNVNEADLNLIYGTVQKEQMPELFQNILLEKIIDIIYGKLASREITLDDKYRFLGISFTIGQFIHYPITYYYGKMNLARALAFIIKLKTELQKTTEICFKYELRILLDLQQYNALESLIQEELGAKEREVQADELWYLIFRAYYSSRQLEKFLNLPNVDQKWLNIADFELEAQNASESMPSLAKFKDVYSPVCPFFSNDIIKHYELVSLFVYEIEKEAKRRENNDSRAQSPRNNMTHLFVPFFANWLHIGYEFMGIEEDFGANLLTLTLKYSDMYQGFLTVYEEMLEKFTNWVGPNSGVQVAMDRIALMRTTQAELVQKIL